MPEIRAFEMWAAARSSRLSVRFTWWYIVCVQKTSHLEWIKSSSWADSKFDFFCCWKAWGGAERQTPCCEGCSWSPRTMTWAQTRSSRLTDCTHHPPGTQVLDWFLTIFVIKNDTFKEYLSKFSHQSVFNCKLHPHSLWLTPCHSFSFWKFSFKKVNVGKSFC